MRQASAIQRPWHADDLRQQPRAAVAGDEAHAQEARSELRIGGALHGGDRRDVEGVEQLRDLCAPAR
jgi:hypothetical protein